MGSWVAVKLGRLMNDNRRVSSSVLLTEFPRVTEKGTPRFSLWRRRASNTKSKNGKGFQGAEESLGE